MRLALAFITIFMSTVNATAEVIHDKDQCPNLVGDYVIENQDFGDMNFRIQSQEGSDFLVLNLTLEDEGTTDSILLDGQQYPVSSELLTRGVCSNQQVFLYEYDGEGVLYLTTAMTLLDNRDLLIEMQDQDGASETIAQRALSLD